MTTTEKIINQLDSINEVNTMLMQCQSQEELIEKALAEVRRRLNVQVASIFLFTKEGVIRRVGIDGVDKDGNPIDDHWLPNEEYHPGESFSGSGVLPTGELAYGKPQYSNNIFAEYDNMKYGKFYKDKLGKLKCGISVPLNGLSRTFGTIEVINKQDNREFQEAELYWLMLIGTSVANLIVSFSRKRKKEVYDKLTEVLVDLDIKERNFNLETVCQYAADQIIADFTSFQVCIIRIADENDDLEMKAKSNTSQVAWEGRYDTSVKASIAAGGSRIVREVYYTQEPQFIEDIELKIEKFKNKDWISYNSLKSFACLPLSVDRMCVGTISIYTKYRHKFSQSNQDFLENIAFLLAAIISKFRLIKQLRIMQKERNDDQEKFMNASLLISFETMAQEVLHKYKNQLINIYQFLEKISRDNIKIKDKQDMIAQKKIWINERIKEIEAELKIDEAAPIDINQAIKEAIKNMRFEFSDLDIKINAEYDDTIPFIAIDERVIKDITFNLLSNAQRAIEETQYKNKPIRTGEIKVTTSVDTLNRIQYIKIIVEDNGIGIPNEISNRIFERGFTTRNGGTGVGLFTVREALKQYGGRVSFESQVDKGTKFLVLIPLKRNLA